MTNTIYLLLGTFLLVTFFSKVILYLVFEKGKYENRLKKYIEYNDVIEARKKPEQQDSLVKKASLAIEKVVNLSKNESLLIQSGVKLSLGELLIGRAMVAIIVMMIGYFYQLHFLIIALIGVIGFYLPIHYVKKKRKKRLQLCSDQLGSTLGTMANSLRAGFSFMQTMQMVAKEAGEPLGEEFTKAIQEINYGLSVEESFKNLLDRLPNKELEIVLNTLIIQRSSGGNLAFLLETIQETILDRNRVKDEVKALTSQGKMSSVIITLLPLALALYLKLVNPEYFEMLFSHPLGWVMVIVGSLNILLGWLFVKKIVQIEV
ncbi:type II secretion system F family protein [Virgibacillus sp. C22-A2]|uniref:Type II secretion system F family protein n=1 Tax=Virgibacillus tibetensis TaxID=3042313 RepID=A0ABU6KFR6_9BACI|nr:type II secretion system F family protein [Virgibacillus sp. C22-A2]